MKDLFRALNYVKGYWKYALLNILFNIFFSVFSVFSITLVIPFMDLLFQTNEKLIEYSSKAEPVLSLNGDSIKDFFYYKMSSYITQYGIGAEQIAQGKKEALIFICISVVVLIFFKNLFRYFAMFFLAPIRNGVVRDLRNRMMKKALALPLSYYSNERKGDIISRMTSDVQEIEWSIMQTLELIFREPIIIIVSLAWLIGISPYLTLYVLILLPVAGAIVALVGRGLKRSSSRSKEMLGGLFSIMEETLGALKVIKAFTGEKFIQKKFESMNQKHYKLSVGIYRKTDLSSPVSESVVVAALMIVMFLGGSLVLANNGALSAAAFMGYFAIASQILPPIKQITVAYNSIQKGIASEERIDQVLKARLEIMDPEQPVELKEFKHSIEYKNLSFAYTKGDAGYVLKKINLQIEKGKTIALVGQSGSGKTTLADMLPRFYDPSEGEICIDGVSLKNMRLQDVRSLMGIVSQESVLFNDSIHNNIAFGIETATREQVIEAAKIANAHDFIMQMPQGYDSNIGDRGGKLSGGQKQRLSIARAILKNPPILILDEATSALDTESERIVQDALNSLMRNRTSVIIAHRLSTIVHADEIIVLMNGEIIERGNHQYLLGQNGTYKKLFDMQSFK
ncbi:MAG: Xenobiotic-transporting ATPase [Bacteroidetes bacterium]|jgi:ABC-type multidrug transport system fused ATPase/permease subunit|nr:Xenobiotic-transporting ATPase [Bacteroidota bacterium]